MIDIKLKYAALIYLNTSDIQPTPDIVSEFITLFRDKELIPYIDHREFRFTGAGQPMQVLMKLTDKKGEWNIAFSDGRIDVEQLALDPKGTNLVDIEVFSQTASSCARI